MKHNDAPGLIVALDSHPPDHPGKTGDGATTYGGDGDRDGDGGSKGNMDYVPIDALSMPDDQEQIQAPEVGDSVNYQVTGKVVSIENGQACVQRETINGQDVSQQPSENNDEENPGNANGGDEYGDMRSQAADIGNLT